MRKIFVTFRSYASFFFFFNFTAVMTPTKGIQFVLIFTIISGRKQAHQLHWSYSTRINHVTPGMNLAHRDFPPSFITVNCWSIEMLNHVTGGIKVIQHVRGLNLLFSQIPFPGCFAVPFLWVPNGCFKPCWLQLDDICVVKGCVRTACYVIY